MSGTPNPPSIRGIVGDCWIIQFLIASGLRSETGNEEGKIPLSPPLQKGETLVPRLLGIKVRVKKFLTWNA